MLTQPIFQMGHVPDHEVGTTRIPDEAGPTVPADRSRWDVRSHARGDLASDQTGHRMDRSNGGRNSPCRLANAITCARQPGPAYCAFAASRVAALRLHLPLTPLRRFFTESARCASMCDSQSVRVKRLDNLLLIEAFPDMALGSACASSFSRLARRSLALRPAHSRCHRIS